MIPTLETARTLLRGHTVDDFTASAAMWSDPRVVRHISGQPSSREQSWSRLLRYAGHWRLLGFGYWVIEDRQNGEFLGEVGFADYRRDITPALTDKPEAGWVLCRAAHGRGLASETVAAMLDWADDNLNAPVTSCIIAPQHEASLNVARKAGYRRVADTVYLHQPTRVLERPRRPR